MESTDVWHPMHPLSVWKDNNTTQNNYVDQKTSIEVQQSEVQQSLGIDVNTGNQLMLMSVLIVLALVIAILIIKK